MTSASIAPDQDYERALRDAVAAVFGKLDVSFLSVQSAPGSVIEATVQLPAWQDRAVRHDVIQALADFEADVGWAVVVSPTFVWSAPEPDAD